MKIAKLIAFVLAGIFGALALMPYGLTFALGPKTSSEAASVGIIGSADGPTAIFVATPYFGAPFLCGLCVVVGIVLHFIDKNRQNKGNNP